MSNFTILPISGFESRKSVTSLEQYLCEYPNIVLYLRILCMHHIFTIATLNVVNVTFCCMSFLYNLLVVQTIVLVLICLCWLSPEYDVKLRSVTTAHIMGNADWPRCGIDNQVSLTGPQPHHPDDVVCKRKHP